MDAGVHAQRLSWAGWRCQRAQIGGEGVLLVDGQRWMGSPSLWREDVCDGARTGGLPGRRLFVRGCWLRCWE